MIIYELMVDQDMTTRSSPYSVGLFKTREAAKRQLDQIGLKSWQRSSIEKREVFE